MPREYQYPFELRHLVYFREVARQLHYRKAAESLAVAQPALSRSISQLEREMGVDLLNRTRRKVELTAAGRAFLERIEPLLRALAAVPADIQALAGGQAGQVRVAFTGLAMATVLPGILREFNRRYPGIGAGGVAQVGRNCVRIFPPGGDAHAGAFDQAVVAGEKRGAASG
jgi:DNA-binding transcriptional LysR family regulator